MRLHVDHPDSLEQEENPVSDGSHGWNRGAPAGAVDDEWSDGSHSRGDAEGPVEHQTGGALDAAPRGKRCVPTKCHTHRKRERQCEQRRHYPRRSLVAATRGAAKECEENEERDSAALDRDETAVEPAASAAADIGHRSILVYCDDCKADSPRKRVSSPNERTRTRGSVDRRMQGSTERPLRLLSVWIASSTRKARKRRLPVGSVFTPIIRTGRFAR